MIVFWAPGPRYITGIERVRNTAVRFTHTHGKLLPMRRTLNTYELIVSDILDACSNFALEGVRVGPICGSRISTRAAQNCIFNSHHFANMRRQYPATGTFRKLFQPLS
ncbi:hypothetical protein EVAR_27051_1 [Eumeta japonica]|uniref:Uncharacterized protein n=1 Tax=Eumeta variegata TaxID=151549 RepID=A0A4C1WG33_EUMVA|nr:hypothetical protein EVAR_27051_1 [Eumeta japonica]